MRCPSPDGMCKTDVACHRCHLVPKAIEEELDRQLPFPMMQNAKKYWWRAQASAWVMRLKAASLAELYSMRLDSTKHTGFTLSSSGSGLQTLDMPYPLPQGTISMHVRYASQQTLVDCSCLATAG